MKRRLLALLAACALLLTACGGKAEEPQTARTPADIVGLLTESQDDLPEMRVVTAQDGEFATLLSAYYSIDEALVTDGAISFVDGVGAAEFAVFRLADQNARGEVEQLLLDYIEARIAEFFGYMPDQVALLERAVVQSSGGYTALMICGDPQQAQEAFESCFLGENTGAEGTLRVGATATYAAAQFTDSRGGYDAEAVLAAWRSGSSAGLSIKNLRILNACASVIDQVITDGMSDYEKELAIHDWIIQWAAYDVEVKSRSLDAAPHPDNDNPYGLLYGQRAICSGYTSTFQLFMDMLGIECITVEGTARRGANEHAWNMVKLDGLWYCVDVTWNDPTDLDVYDEVLQHRYFNVTSDMLRETDHQWNEDGVPEATATRYAWSR